VQIFEEFSREYFREELLRFRGLMSEKSFYDDLNKFSDCKSSRAFYGLLYVYVNTLDLTEDDKVLMEATKLEFDRRLGYMLMR